MREVARHLRYIYVLPAAVDAARCGERRCMLTDDCDSFRQRSTSVAMPGEQEPFQLRNDKRTTGATLLAVATIWKNYSSSRDEVVTSA
jgi:hypothetical protein